MKKINIIVTIIISLIAIKLSAPKGVLATNFSFTFAGDYSGSSNATAVLEKIKNLGVNFNLALGDFRYGCCTDATGWTNYVKSHVGDTFPFEIIAGNHDSTGTEMSQYILGLPHRVGTEVTGTYGKQYYFDYPAVSPIARFILLGPNELGYNYSNGNVNYNWVSSSIDNAREHGINWIFVGQHKNCITTATKSCEIGADLMNLMISKRVDLVMQGHDHTYQRSKQLTCATVNSYNPNCVANSGNTYFKGAGTVFMINGSGGNGLYAINTADSENRYFSNWMGSNVNPSWGPVQITVTDNTLTSKYWPATGNYTDSFDIVSSGQTPSASPTPTIIVTRTPTPSPTPGITNSIPPTRIPTPTLTNTPTPTRTLTSTPTVSPTLTPTISYSITPTFKQMITGIPINLTKDPSTTPTPNSEYNNCKQSDNTWQNIAFPPQYENFEIKFDAKSTSDLPTKGILGYIGLSNTKVSSFSNLKTIVSFRPNGLIKVRDGNNYVSSSDTPYSLENTYHFRMVVDLKSRAYSVLVTPDKSIERLLGKNLAFYKQVNTTSLNNLALYSNGKKRSLTVCNLSVAPLNESEDSPFIKK